MKILAKHNWKLHKKRFTNRKPENVRAKKWSSYQHILWNLQVWRGKQIPQNISDSCSRSFYYQIHFIAEPSSNVQVNNNSERKLRHAHQEDDSNNDSIPDDAYDRDDDNDEDSYDRNDDYDEDTYDRNDNNDEDTYDRDDNNDEDTYDRNNDHDKNDDADEDLIRQKHGLRNDDDYLENASEGDEDEADFDSDDDDFDVSEKEKDNLSDENDPQNNPKACKKKSYLLLDSLSMKATLVWKCPLQKKRSFPLKISSVNVTKSAGNCGFGHVYRRNP